MQPSVKDILIEIKKILITPDKWNKGNCFADAKGVGDRVECEWDFGIVYYRPGHPENVASCCLNGAKFLAQGKLNKYLPITNGQGQRYDLVWKHMYSQLPEDFKFYAVPTVSAMFSGVAHFNDYEMTTFEDIHKYLDRCIETAP